jgi:hypothetical protein
MTVLNSSCYNRSGIISITRLTVVILFITISSGFGQMIDSTNTLTTTETVLQFSPDDTIDTTTEEIINEPTIDGGDETIKKRSMRIGLSYEFAMRYPDIVRKNRVGIRMDYSKLLFGNTSLIVDAKAFAFLPHDHRDRQSILWLNDDSLNVRFTFGARVRDAYLQTNFNNTSIKVGVQTLSWGESDFATITDEISPMDYREPLNLNVDELRLGQLMVTVNHYTSFGNLTGFFNPIPLFNQYPRKGTDFYYDPYKGIASISYQLESQEGFFFEAGARWKRTFGKSDISFMAASLINNDYALRRWGYNITYQSKLRYTMTGVTFNRAMDKFLVKGEVAFKTPKAYANRDQQVVKKNNLDASIGVDYSANSTLTMSLEAINYHILDFDNTVKNATRDNYMLLFILTKLLKHNELSVNWVTMYAGPNPAFFNLFSTTYNVTDRLSLSMDIILPHTTDKDSNFYTFRHEQQASFKILYQF